MGMQMGMRCRLVSLTLGLVTLGGCYHPSEQAGDAAMRAKLPEEAAEAYTEALRSGELTQDELERVYKKRRATQDAGIETFLHKLPTIPPEALGAEFQQGMVPFLLQGRGGSATTMEPLLQKLAEALAPLAARLSEHSMVLLEVRELAYESGVSASVLHALDAVTVAAVVSLADGPGKARRIAETRMRLHAAGASEADLAALNAALLVAADRGMAQAVALSAKGDRGAAALAAAESTADLPASSPLSVAAKSLRGTLAEPSLERARATSGQAELQLLHLGLAQVLSGEDPTGYRSLLAAQTSLLGASWQVTEASKNCSDWTRRLAGAFSRLKPSRSGKGSIRISLESCVGHLEEKVNERKRLVSRGSGGGSTSRSTSCVDANGSGTSCSASGTVYAQTTTSYSGGSADQYETIFENYYEYELTLSGEIVAELDGIANRVAINQKLTARSVAMEPGTAQRTQDRAKLAAESELRDKVSSEVGAMATKVVDPILQQRSAQALARFNATGGVGDESEAAFVVAVLRGAKFTETTAQLLLKRYGVSLAQVLAALGQGSVEPKPFALGTRGPETKDARAEGMPQFRAEQILDPREGTYADVGLSLVRASLPNVLLDPDREGLYAKVGGSMRMWSIFVPRTTPFAIHDSFLLNLGVGSLTSTNTTADESSIIADASAGYDLLLGVRTSSFALLGGAEARLRFLRMGSVGMSSLVTPLALRAEYRMGGRAVAQAKLYGANLTVSENGTDVVGFEALVPLGRSHWNARIHAEQWKTGVAAARSFTIDVDTATNNAGRQINTMIGGGVAYAF